VTTEDEVSRDGPFAGKTLTNLSAAFVKFSGDPVISLRTEIATQFDAIYTRFSAIDKATELQHQDLVRVPTQVQLACSALEEKQNYRFKALEDTARVIHEDYVRVPTLLDRSMVEVRALMQEKFDSIKVQFAERDTRTEQTAAGVKIAVDAALQAAKEAVAEQNRSFALATGKSETATMKQIDALGLAIQTANKGLDDKIADMKDRLTRIEGMDLGSSRHRDTMQEDSSAARHDRQNLIATIALVVAGLGLFVAVGIGLYTVSRPTSPPVVYARPPGNAFYSIPRRERQPNAQI
jgi:hypothetical protein